MLQFEMQICARIMWDDQHSLNSGHHFLTVSHTVHLCNEMTGKHAAVDIGASAQCEGIKSSQGLLVFSSMGG